MKTFSFAGYFLFTFHIMENTFKGIMNWETLIKPVIIGKSEKTLLKVIEIKRGNAIGLFGVS